LTALGQLSEEKGLVADAIKYYLSAADILSKDMKKDRFLHIYDKILSLAPSNIPLRDKVAGLFLKEGFVPEAVREYLHIARLSVDRGDTEHARHSLTKVLEIQPENRDALLYLSSLYEKVGDSSRALEYARKAVDADHDDLESLQRCADLQRGAGEYLDALTYLTRIRELAPHDHNTIKLIGDIYRSLGDRQKAWELYRNVVEAYRDEKRTGDAIDLLKEFRDIDPLGAGKLLISFFGQTNNREGVFRETVVVAGLLQDRGLRDEGLAYYREALKIRPDDMEIKKKIAQIEIEMGLQPSLLEEEKTTEYLIGDADIFLKYGLYDEARSILEDLGTKEPENTDVHGRLKSLYRETHDLERAVTECLILAKLFEKQGDAGKKEAALREALAINPADPRLTGQVSPAIDESASSTGMSEESLLDEYSEEIAEAEFYMRQGLSQDALRIYQKLSDIFPDNAEFQQKIASLQGEAPEPQETTEEIPESQGEDLQLEEYPHHEPDMVEASEPSELQIDSDVLDIFEEFKKGIEKELEAEDYETHCNLGIAYKEMGLVDDAIKEFQVCRRDPKYYVSSLSMLGICYMDKGLFPLAIDAFKNALPAIDAHDESYWGAKYDLASAYEKNGNMKEAFDIFSEIYGWDSRFREVSEKLDKLRMIPGMTESAPTKGKKDRISYL
jgi:tetratricopeptide (TPR) repeat protein